jgi:hypothetical protein
VTRLGDFYFGRFLLWAIFTLDDFYFGRFLLLGDFTLGDFLIRPNFRAFFLGKSDASFLTEN